MKRILAVILIAGILFTGAPIASGAEPAQKPHLFEVFVSPRLTPNQAEMAWRAVLSIFEKRLCQPNDELILTDADTKLRVTSIKLGDRILSCSDTYMRFKVTLHARELGEINRFFRVIKERNVGNDTIPDLDAPSLFRLTGQRATLYPNHQKHVIFIGSAIYVDHQNKGNTGFSTIRHWPGDGHLSDPYSPFSAKGRERLLSGVVVHWLYTDQVGQGGFVNDLHRDRLERFWALLSQHLGGALVTFSPDSAIAARIVDPPPPAIKAEIDPAEKAIMYSVERSTIWQELKSAPSPPPASTQGSLTIGIKWQCKCDLDLWVGLKGVSERASYGSPISPFAVYIRDHLSSDFGQDEYETVDFSQPVNLSDVTAEVNFFSGRSSVSPTMGQVRVEFNGQIYTSDFSLKATNGNLGFPSRSHWTTLNLPAIVGLAAAN